MKISIIFLISLLTNFAVGKNVIKCSKTKIGKVGYECNTILEAPVYDSIAKNGKIIEANVAIREKRSPAKRKKKGKTKKKEIFWNLASIYISNKCKQPNKIFGSTTICTYCASLTIAQPWRKFRTKTCYCKIFQVTI